MKEMEAGNPPLKQGRNGEKGSRNSRNSNSSSSNNSQVLRDEAPPGAMGRGGRKIPSRRGGGRGGGKGLNKAVFSRKEETEAFHSLENEKNPSIPSTKNKLVSHSKNKIRKEKLKKQQQAKQPLPTIKTKVVCRHLPVNLTEEAFMQQVMIQQAQQTEPLVEISWQSCLLRFNPGKKRKNNKSDVPARAYFSFKTQPEITSQALKILNTMNIAVVATNNSSSDDGETATRMALAEKENRSWPMQASLALYQKVPKDKPRKDKKEGTLEEDPDYQAFLAKLNTPEEKLPSAEVQLDLRSKEAIHEEPIIAPLVQYLLERRAKRAKVKGKSKVVTKKESNSNNSNNNSNNSNNSSNSSSSIVSKKSDGKKEKGMTAPKNSGKQVERPVGKSSSYGKDKKGGSKSEGLKDGTARSDGKKDKAKERRPNKKVTGDGDAAGKPEMKPGMMRILSSKGERGTLVAASNEKPGVALKKVYVPKDK